LVAPSPVAPTPKANFVLIDSLSEPKLILFIHSSLESYIG